MDENWQTIVPDFLKRIIPSSWRNDLPGVRKDSVENVLQSYRFTGEILGLGTFGVVYKAYDRKVQDREVAIKRVDIRGKGITTVLEILFMRQLRSCNNIVRLIDDFQVNGFSCLVMEMAIGNLTDIIRKRSGLPEIICCYVTSQMLDALVFIHTHHIIHRDVSSKNVLVFADGTCKLGDFGESCEWTCGGVTGMHGTRLYMAPEVLLQNEDLYLGRTYDESCDIWSLGIILYECAEGTLPIQPMHRHEFRNFILACAFRPFRLQKNRDKYSFDMNDIIKHMLVICSKRRWSADQLLNHNWIQTRKPFPIGLSLQFLEMLHTHVERPANYSTCDFDLSTLDEREDTPLEFSRNRYTDQDQEVNKEDRDFLWFLKMLFCCCLGK